MTDTTPPASKPPAPSTSAPPPRSHRPWYVRLPIYLAVATAGALLAFAGWRAFMPDAGSSQSALNVPPANAPAIGGAFSLVDQTGRRVTDADFRGKLMLVYFGFTYCPDVCPTTLTIMSDALALLTPDEAAHVQPLFITVDPARDTPEQLAEYVQYFNDRLLGLSGTPEDIAAVARAYRVYYAKVAQTGSDGVADADADDYVMDHTSILYLMDGNGQYARHFSGSRAEPDAIATAIRALLE